MYQGHEWQWLEQGLTAERLLRLLVQIRHGDASSKKCIVGVLDRERGSSLGRQRIELHRRDSGVDTPNHGLRDEHLQTQRKGWVAVRNSNIRTSWVCNDILVEWDTIIKQGMSPRARTTL